MNFLWISLEQNTCAIAQKVVQQGHNVKFFPKTNDDHMDGFGIQFVDDWHSHVGWADVIVNDDVLLPNPDDLFLSGKPVISGNKLTNKMENDRIFGKNVFKRCGLDIRDSVHFDNFDTAIGFLKANPDRWVFKADGQAFRTLGFVGKDKQGKDVIDRLLFYKEHATGRMKKHWDKKLGVSFMLERAADGLEVAVGAYFDGRSFSGTNINFEHKKRSVGDLGISTGEMGTVVYLLEKRCTLFHRTLEKLTPILKKTNYHGYVDLNCIVTRNKAYVLEITSRFGWPIEAALDQLRTVTTAKFLAALARGTASDDMFKDKCAIVYTVGTYGFPYEAAYDELGASQPFKIPVDKLKHIYLMDVCLKDKKLYTSEAGEGYILFVSCASNILKTAQQETKNILEKIELPGIDYRIDIGDKVESYLTQLKNWKWL